MERFKQQKKTPCSEKRAGNSAEVLSEAPPPKAAKALPSATTVRFNLGGKKVKGRPKKVVSEVEDDDGVEAEKKAGV